MILSYKSKLASYHEVFGSLIASVVLLEGVFCRFYIGSFPCPSFVTH